MSEGRGDPLIRVTAMPADTNPYGGVFGGWLMSQMALAAGSLASRHALGKAVVVAADALSFDHRAIDGADGARLNEGVQGAGGIAVGVGGVT